MNRDIVAGNWKLIKGYLKTQWNRFTGNRPGVIAGMRLTMAGRIQVDCGNTNQEADQQLRRFAKNNKDYRYKGSL
ncbi:MAG: general stress protein CsbD [Sterolibacterium sp.]